MYLIYKGDEYFGVCYDNIEMAIYVCAIFEKTLGCKFNIRMAYKYAGAQKSLHLAYLNFIALTEYD